MDLPHTDAPVDDSGWRYEIPPTGAGNCLLLTIGNRCVEGTWYGEYGFAFKAWAPKPKRDKAREKALGVLA